MVHLLRDAIESLFSHPRLLVVFEWPKLADGWKQPEVMQLVQCLPHQILFDGCAYGLVDHQGEPIRKLWRLQASQACLEPLGRTCPGHARHGACRGKAATESGLYTDEMVVTVMNLIEHWAGIDRRSRPREVT